VFENQVPTIQPGDVATRVADGWMLLDVRTDDESGRLDESRARSIFRWIS